LSKFSYQTLQKCVYPYRGSPDEHVLLGSAFGEDVSLTRVGDHLLASHVDPIIGAVAHIGRLAVHIACNDIAAAGVRPRWILTLVLVPSPHDEDLLKKIMGDIDHAAREIQVAVIGGHSGFSSGISRPLVAVTALGTANPGDPVLTRGARAGDHILVTKGIGLEGTAILATDFRPTALQLGLSEADLDQAAALMEQISVVEDGLTLAASGARAMHDVTRGGLLETLLEMAHLSEVGIELDYHQLPIPPVVGRFAARFEFDPLRMISSGTLAAAVPPEKLEISRASLAEKGIPCAAVGRVIKGSGVRVSKGGKTEVYHELQAEEDELTSMWEKYPPRP